MREISIRSPFPPEECARRLEAVTEPDRGGLWEDLTRTYAVLARLRGSRVRLRVRHPYTRNAFAPIFYGRFEAIPGGTLLRGRFRTRTALLAFVVAWFAAMALVVGSIFVADLRAGTVKPWPLLLIGGVAVLMWILRRRGREDEEDVLRMLRRALEARR